MIRREYQLRGVVQGVGFRPHAASVAARHPVVGFVGNDDEAVFLEAQGDPDAVDAFVADVLATLPPLAHVIATTSRDVDPVPGDDAFRIVPSRRAGGARTLIPPDVATCPDCLADMANPDDRRYRYPFTTCTNCGPRLTIIRDLPYDRPATTMVDFPMCPACASEYTTPTDRRFHAQPISCPDCGPALWIVESGDTQAGRPASVLPCHDVIEDAAARLRAGQVLAVKGLGGFHLLCDARNAAAVERLRARKRRSGKPFAVMVGSLEAARRLARLSDEQAALLASPARPIVIVPQASGYDLAEQVAPGLGDVGVLLPYTPLHTLLVEGFALVATSGNLSDEPLAYRNDDALARLAGLADAFVLHDRAIHVPVEDSVFLAGDATIPVRRSRGYAPLPVVLPGRAASGATVLAVGGELKNTFALASGDLAHLSAHQGDMGSLPSQRAFEASVAQFVGIQRSTPELVVADLHPGYATTAWAQRFADAHGVRLLQVQHHHAHALALLAEHGLDEPAVVATLDGTGYGTDATIWGGEVLVVDGASFERVWHLPTFPLVGGDRAVRQPWRIALGLGRALGLDLSHTPLSDAPAAERRVVESALDAGVGVVQTSSAGRLFDAASAMLGLCLETTYEAQAAMELERCATGYARTGHAGPTDRQPTRAPRDTTTLMAELLEPRPVDERAWRFHCAFAVILADALAQAAVSRGLSAVGLTGGVAMNRLLLTQLRAELHDRGLVLLTHRTVPPNDGGLALGQAVYGRLAGQAGCSPNVRL